jgi:cytochrome c oxidase subunit 2
MRRAIARGALLGAIVLGGILGWTVLARGAAGDSNEARVVRIVAQRFSYTPNRITLKRGQAAVLQFTSMDFVHGFNVPDLHVRADLPPGKVTLVHITPQKAGVYDMLCDNFCGAKHEEMNGQIIVVD